MFELLLDIFIELYLIIFIDEEAMRIMTEKLFTIKQRIKSAVLRMVWITTMEKPKTVTGTKKTFTQMKLVRHLLNRSILQLILKLVNNLCEKFVKKECLISVCKYDTELFNKTSVLYRHLYT